MTSRPAGRQQSQLDLVEEVVSRDAQSEQRQSEYDGVAQRDVVLAQGVPDDVLRPRVVETVDLDHHAPCLPGDVEVVGAVSASSHDLAGGLRQTATPALPREVQLAQ